MDKRDLEAAINKSATLTRNGVKSTVTVVGAAGPRAALVDDAQGNRSKVMLVELEIVTKGAP